MQEQSSSLSQESSSAWLNSRHAALHRTQSKFMRFQVVRRIAQSLLHVHLCCVLKRLRL